MSDDLDPIAAEPVGFRWPTPPLASYPSARAQLDHEPCEIVGLNGRVMQGRLHLFVPEEMNKTTFVQGAKDWTQILSQFGLGLAAIKTLGN